MSPEPHRFLDQAAPAIVFAEQMAGLIVDVEGSPETSPRPDHLAERIVCERRPLEPLRQCIESPSVVVRSRKVRALQGIARTVALVAASTAARSAASDTTDLIARGRDGIRQGRASGLRQSVAIGIVGPP